MHYCSCVAGCVLKLTSKQLKEICFRMGDNSHLCFSLVRLLGYVPGGGAPFSQLNKGVKDAMAISNEVIHHQHIKQKHAKKPQELKQKHL